MLGYYLTKNLEEKNSVELSNELEKIFKQVNIIPSTFNKLFKVILKNEKSFKYLSQCLLYSFKYKKKEDIKALLEQNIVCLKKKIIISMNDNIIKIIFSLEKNIKENNRRFYDFVNYSKIQPMRKW